MIQTSHSASGQARIRAESRSRSTLFLSRIRIILSCCKAGASRRLEPKRLMLLLQSETVSVPGNRLAKTLGLEAYELGEVGSRYAHVKLVITEAAVAALCLRAATM
jgi:hypothetical protein